MKVLQGGLKKVKTAEEIEAALENFHGTQNYYKLSENTDLLFTDGVKYLLENANCFYLLNVIEGLQQRQEVKEAGLQVWKYSAKDGCIRVFNDMDLIDTLVGQAAFMVNFPLEELTLWCQAGGPGSAHVVFLPSEY